MECSFKTECLMTSIDVSVFNRKSNRPHNAALSGQTFAPLCGGCIPIKQGPSPRKIVQAPLDDVSDEFAALYGLFEDWNGNLVDGVSHLVLNHLPVRFVATVEEGEITVAVFVASVDFDPKRQLYPPVFFHGYLGQEFSESTMLIRGWYVTVPERHRLNKEDELSKRPLTECFIVYDPDGGRSGKGYIFPMFDERPLPLTQVIKDAEALQRLVNEHFRGGWMEAHTPDGFVHWGFSPYSEGDWISVKAIQENEEKWRFQEPDSAFQINLVGTTLPINGNPSELMGDAILCSDGTILHTYHFCFKTFEKVPPAEWRNGHYFNRFYPLQSSLVPRKVVESFYRDMPAWFKVDLLPTTK